MGRERGDAGDRDGSGGVRPVPARARTPASDRRAALQRRRAGVLVPAPRAGAAARGPLRGEGSGDEGDGRRALEVRAARRRGPRAAERSARGDRCTTRRPHSPRSAASASWLLTLTHTDGMAMAVAVALAMKPLVTPAEMGEADRRTIAAGTPFDVLMDRAGSCGGVGGARRVRWCLRPARGRSSAARATTAATGWSRRGSLRGWGMRVDTFALDPGVDRPRFTRCAAPGRRRRRRDVRDGLPRRARRRRGVGGRRPSPMPACRSSRSTSPPGSTGSPARSRRSRSGPTARSRSPRCKPGLVFEPGRDACGNDHGRRHRDRRRRGRVGPHRRSRRRGVAAGARRRARTSGRSAR